MEGLAGYYQLVTYNLKLTTYNRKLITYKVKLTTYNGITMRNRWASQRWKIYLI